MTIKVLLTPSVNGIPDKVMEEIHSTGLMGLYNGAVLSEIPNPYDLTMLNKDGTDFETMLPDGIGFVTPQGGQSPVYTVTRGGLTSFSGNDVTSGNVVSRFDLEVGALVAPEREYMVGMIHDQKLDSLAGDYSSVYFGDETLKYGVNHYDVLGTATGYTSFTSDLKQNRAILTAKKTATITKMILHGKANTRKDDYDVEEFGLFEILEDNTNIEYEPYKEPQTVRLQLEKPLTKWDRLEKREGVWGIARQSV